MTGSQMVAAAGSRRLDRRDFAAPKN